MKSKLTAAVTALFLCIAAIACSPTYQTDAPVTASSSASDTYAGLTPSASTGPDVSPDIQPPAITAKPSPSASPETSQPTQATSQPSGETASPLHESPSQETAPQSPLPSDADFVRILDYIPTIYVDLKYATDDNFTGQVIYDFNDAYLRYGTVKKLAEVQDALAEQGFSLKIWDAFRPVEAQFKLWEAYPDPNFVADPTKGHSSHSKGNTVDVTLVLHDGTEIQMPSAFDDFTDIADRDYSDADTEAAANALILENNMLDCGFSAYSQEWWHFSDTTPYPVEETFAPQ
jgi:D-alanyl-D-alanine dipeptidase